MKIKKPQPSIKIPTPLDQVSYIHDKWKNEIAAMNSFHSLGLDMENKNSLKIAMSIIETGLLPNENIKDVSKLFLSTTFFQARQIAVQEYGYPLLNEIFLDDLSKTLQNDNVLDIGAGSGFLSKHLNDRGNKITAIDKYQKQNRYGFTNPYFKIYEDDGVNHLLHSGNKYDTVILSWPPYDTEMGYTILNAMQAGQRLIYIGESEGGCTADKAFFKLLHDKAILIQDETEMLEENYTRYAGIHDRPSSYIIRK